MAANEWKMSEHVDHYLELVDTVPRVAEGESVLLDQLPLDARRILDLGTGDGRLLALVRADRPASVALALDVSEPMLERARERFAGQPVEVLHHDLAEPLECEDPSDRLVDVETQLRWLREVGFDDVDCYWKWLELALLVGVKPVRS